MGVNHSWAELCYYQRSATTEGQMRFALDLAIFGVVLVFGVTVFESAAYGALAGIIIVAAADALVWDTNKR
jgi:hypothetical protein